MVAITRPPASGLGLEREEDSPPVAAILAFQAQTSSSKAGSSDPRSLVPEVWQLVRKALTAALRPSATASRLEPSCGIAPVNPGRGPDYPDWPSILGKGVGLCPKLLWEEP